MRILVLGASGMLGHAMVRVLAEGGEHEVTGTLRSARAKSYFEGKNRVRLISGVDAENQDTLERVYSDVRPEAVVNCIGLVKQSPEAGDPLFALPINAVLPHRLARLCGLSGSRLVHVSTDCVFSGRKGMYTEADEPDALDLYGRSKLLGEVEEPHAITLRTSMIGHEIASRHGLVEWFLSQSGRVRGFTKAIFSGLPTCELARLVRHSVLPRPELSGVFHVAGQPIAKYDLLKLINEEYNKGLTLEEDDKLSINRSLDAARFNKAVGYSAPPWPELVTAMHEFK